MSIPQAVIDDAKRKVAELEGTAGAPPRKRARSGGAAAAAAPPAAGAAAASFMDMDVSSMTDADVEAAVRGMLGC